MSLIHWLQLNDNFKDMFTDSSKMSAITTNSCGKLTNYALGNGSVCFYKPGTWKISSIEAPVSISFWIKIITLNESDNSWYTFLSLSDSNIWDKKYFSISAKSSRIKVAIVNNEDSYVQEIAIDNDIWTHFVITYSGNSNYITKYFVNNNLITTSANKKWPFLPERCLLAIGNATNTLYKPFKGLLNDFRVYDTNLSIKELNELQKACILHYSFEELTSDMTIGRVIDSSGYGHHGIRTELACTTAHNKIGNISLMYDNNYLHNIEVQNLDPAILDGFTINVWYRSGQILGNNFVLVNGQDSTHYLMSIDLLSASSGNVSGDLKYFIDGKPKILGRPINNQWHMYTVTCTGKLTDWTKLYFSRHDESKNYNGLICDIKIFASVLTAKDIQSLYAQRIAIDRNANLFCGSAVIENDSKIAFKGNRTVIASDIQEDANTVKLYKSNVVKAKEIIEN